MHGDEPSATPALLDLAHALALASTAAYGAVPRPVEGTMQVERYQRLRARARRRTAPVW